MLIVSDASPIIALAVCNKLNLLDQLFSQIYIPQAVFNELAIPDKPKAVEIIQWARNKVTPVQNQSISRAFSMSLDHGESEALLYIGKPTLISYLLMKKEAGLLHKGMV